MMKGIQIPKDWKWVRLKDISESIQYGYTESSSKEIVGPKFLRITDIQENKVVWNEVPYCKIDKETQKKYLLKDGDLVFARTGATVGKSFLLKGVIPEAVFASYLIRVRVNKEINEKYLSNFFHSTIYWAQITEGQVGIGQPNVNGTKLGQLNLPLPPKITQQAIVSKIEELFSELDKGIENLRTAQQQLKTYRQSVLKWAFEGKLTNENIKEGELPKRWKMVKTIDVIEIINNGYTPTSQYLSQDSGEVPFIKVYNLNFDGSLNFKKNPTFIPFANHKKDLKRSICLPGDVLINIVGPPLGKVSVVTNQYPEWNINQAIVMFRPNEKVLSKYISYFMQNSVTINWLENTSKATAGQWNVKVSTCREIPFPFCSVKDQTEIIQEIESRLSVADKMEESISQSLQLAEALRQSILKKAFEGRLAT
jgi:type I restriction enzyme, S subunit